MRLCAFLCGPDPRHERPSSPPNPILPPPAQIHDKNSVVLAQRLNLTYEDYLPRDMDTLNAKQGPDVEFYRWAARACAGGGRIQLQQHWRPVSRLGVRPKDKDLRVPVVLTPPEGAPASCGPSWPFPVQRSCCYVTQLTLHCTSPNQSVLLPFPFCAVSLTPLPLLPLRLVLVHLD